MSKCVRSAVLALCFLVCASSAKAGTEGSITGSIVDNMGIAISNAKVKLLSTSGAVVKETTSSATGDYEFFPVQFGDYTLAVNVAGYAPYTAGAHVSSGGQTTVPVQLSAPSGNKELVLKVKATRHMVQTTTSSSAKEVTSEQISSLPQGENVSLPHLLASTTPGVIQGPFGQTFIRGNHANIQYQIDGVQLPDSQTNSFGDAFTPRNIDHMEVITGGIPAEYGNRLAAVINIVTKTGPEKPSGEAEVNYGSYSTVSPYLIYGGSTPSGDLHYFLSAQYNRTARGLDTPQPINESDQDVGGKDAIHDYSNANNQFLKLDWLPDNNNKLTFIAFNSYTFYQVPNLPSNFLPTDSMFQSGFTDHYGNNTAPNPVTPNPPSVFNWTPANTNDTQAQDDAYAELVWKHSFDAHTFLQSALYYKYSLVKVGNDPANDLLGASLIPYANPDSFAENRHVNNIGMKSDFTNRINERNLFKTGYQVQGSLAQGVINVISGTNTSGTTPIPASKISYTPSIDSSSATGYAESVYAQDDFTINKQFVLNIGVRFDAIQYYFNHLISGNNASSLDNQIEPRIGLNYFPGETTKIHVFYGRLFMPAPLEDLRDTFNTVNNVASNALNFYDIKAEKDDYFETGVAQQVGDHVLTLNSYYKRAYNMLDDTELLNTSLAAAYNYTTGYAYGIEFSATGKLGSHFSDYVNYAFEIAKGQGASGGLFALPPGTVIPPGYLYLDHVQEHTVNGGLSYDYDEHFRATLLALFGSGLRTGPNNTLSLPDHFTLDTTLGYDFHGDTWLSKAKLSFDVLNIFDNPYPITVANGFNASHYAAGRTFFVRLTKEL